MGAPGVVPGRRGAAVRTSLVGLVALATGLGIGYAAGLRRGPPRPAEGRLAGLQPHTLPVRWGDLGARLVNAGALDPGRLEAALASAGTPLTDEQRTILGEGSDDPIEIDRANSLFLLDLFWALGLTNRNPLLTRGPMIRDGLARVGRFASTGGWRLGSKPSNELYASLPLVTLSAEEQERLARVATAVYRPCCDNPAAFPDCNHGMAMLGMLTVLAADGATEARMFEAAAAANAVWYPAQYRELDLFLQATEPEGAPVDPKRLVGRELASGRGFADVHASLAARGLLQAAPSSGVSAC